MTFYTIFKKFFTIKNLLMKNLFFLTLCNIFLFNALAQEAAGGSPASLTLELNKRVPNYTLEALNVAQLLAEDIENGKNGVGF